MDMDGYCYYIGIGGIFNLGGWRELGSFAAAGDARSLTLG